MNRTPAERSRQAVLIGVVLLLMSLVAFTQSGCGGNQRRTTLSVELVALNTARDEFVKWDKSFQQSIVDKALAEGVSKDEVKQRVAAYRATVQTAAMLAFAYAYGEIANASVDDKVPITKALELAGALVKRVHELRTTPGRDPLEFFSGAP